FRAAREPLVDPAVRLLEPGLERGRRLPAEPLEDERVVAVAAADSLRSRAVVVPLQLDARDLLDDVDEAVDRHQLRAAEVDRLAHLARDQPEDPVDRER